jgi:hypothetical protein
MKNNKPKQHSFWGEFFAWIFVTIAIGLVLFFALGVIMGLKYFGVIATGVPMLLMLSLSLGIFFQTKEQLKIKDLNHPLSKWITYPLLTVVWVLLFINELNHLNQ